jgi:spore maturation protein SpmA
MRTTTFVLILSMLSGGMTSVFAAEQTQAVEALAWKSVAAAIPLGSRVKAQTLDGRRVSGTLMRVGDEEVLVKKNSRLPEPAVTIAFADLSRLERDHPNNGFTVAKLLGVGLGVGAGAMTAFLLFLMQID